MSDKYNIPVSIDGRMFKRFGAWFGIFQRAVPFSDETLFLGTCRGMAAMAPEKNRLIGFAPTYGGKKVPHTVQAFPSELKIVTKYGDIRFTFADETKMVAKGDSGMGLQFEKNMVKHESVHPRKNGAWEAFFRSTCAIVFKGLEGSSFTFDDGKGNPPWPARRHV